MQAKPEIEKIEAHRRDLYEALNKILNNMRKGKAKANMGDHMNKMGKTQNKQVMGDTPLGFGGGRR